MNNRISPTCRASQPEMGTATAFATEKEEVLGEPWSRNALVVAHNLVNVRIELRMKDKPHQLRRLSTRWSSPLMKCQGMGSPRWCSRTSGYSSWEVTTFQERIPLPKIARAHELAEHPARSGRIVVIP
ncbi:MAG: hypothetical protein JO151_01325 [Verrucomicrobia bacterium]|nr:hypothetical protein [Verrucomicrobiota bacterium]